MEDDILDSALKDFEEEEKEVKKEPTVKPESVHEVINDLKQEMQDEPENIEMLEKLMKNLADELETNTDLKQGIEDLGNQFFQGGVLLESMTELRDKLKSYISTHASLPPSDLDRYRNQLSIYEQICALLQQGKDDEAMELVGKLSYYGEMPDEIMPPMPQDCLLM